jgi:hypothetical protein
MTKPDRQKLSILVILLAVLGLTIVLGYRMNQPESTAAVQVPDQPKTSATAPSDARIQLDLVEKHDAGEDIGKKNVFQYRQTPPPALPGPKPGAATFPPPASAVVAPPISSRPPGPPPAPPPPPIPLKYFGNTTKTPAGMTAFLVDDTRPNDLKHFNVSTGEVLMGRYRIVTITATSVEIEDLEYSRRQTLPLLK